MDIHEPEIFAFCPLSLVFAYIPRRQSITLSDQPAGESIETSKLAIR